MLTDRIMLKIIGNYTSQPSLSTLIGKSSAPEMAQADGNIMLASSMTNRLLQSMQV